MAQPLLFRLIDKAVYDYKLIQNGDKILVAASGGKDSTALVEYFANRARRPNEDFSFEAFHVETEITKPLSPALTKIFNSWNVEPVNFHVDVLGRLKEGRKMNCYWCSTQRRTELIRYAMANGFNKIALGHHLDDILETLLMNMTEKAQLATMPPLLQYKKYPLTIIRPLCYAPESMIIEHAKEHGYISETCTCGYQDKSFRKETKKYIELLTGGDAGKKSRMFNSLKNICPEYLP